MSYNILVLPGDGIGPEIINEAIKILNFFNHNNQFIIEYDLIGGASIDKHDVPITNKTIEKALNADAVLLGAVGGYKWDNLSMECRPEAGLLNIRKAMNLFTNLRPVKIFSELINSSTLKKEIIEGLDLIIVRELVGGLYFGEPKGIEMINKERKAYNTLCYTETEIKRIGKIAFELAQKRNKKLCSVDKANVLICMKMWREIITELSKEYPDVELTHCYIDAMAMELIKRPKYYDVIVTENMFGDILSDLTSQLTGSIGMLPSASLGNINLKTNKQFALYEPIHGSAPDIAGKNLANPIATIMSVAMMLDYSFNMKNEAKAIENAISKTLKIGYRTSDIYETSCIKIGTKEMGDRILNELFNF